jgi:capsular polysaccharide transport system ATP-binding protein
MIRVSNLTKVYRGHGSTHTALDGINFTVPRGFKLGILGRNGAGKSTLIRLLGKIEMPTSGVVHHEMTVSWPLGFGGAFQGSLTGIDNMKFLSRIYRVDFKRMRSFVEDFSELGHFLYQPVKTYSSGMRARLAFALSICIEFECYLIDEVIMVGDQRFHARCREHIFDRRAERALVIATHDATFMREFCDAAIVLSGGRASYFQDMDKAVAAYANL